MKALFFVIFSLLILAPLKGNIFYLPDHDDGIFSEQQEIKNLADALLTKKIQNEITDEFYYFVKECDPTERTLTLNDDSTWKIGWWYRNEIKNFHKDDRLKLSIERDISSIKIENIDRSLILYGSLENLPAQKNREYIARNAKQFFYSKNETKIILSSGKIFKGPSVQWDIRDEIFIFHQNKGYDLWNLSKRTLARGWVLLGNEKGGSSQSILNIEDTLNQHVLGQKEASQAVTQSLVNYWVGMNDPKTPIGVFLFIGPSGVGKTELAKVLAQELFGGQNQLIRFDMSHFSEPHSVSRLIGSPPGYVNHEEGGQLTEAIKAKPQAIILLDEMEKAHPIVRKLFLPVFDEGYMADAKQRKVPCNHCIFIMTSNICSQEIGELFNQGYSSEEVIEIIEPIMMKELSPELYNRMIPVIFRPLQLEIMDSLVELMLKDVSLRLKSLRNIDLWLDSNVKDYLALHGFHPALGARPLKKLIQKKIVACISFTIIKESIPDGSQITLHYDPSSDAWWVEWQHSDLL